MPDVIWHERYPSLQNKPHEVRLLNFINLINFYKCTCYNLPMRHLLIFLSLSALLYCTDWPQFRGNDSLTGVSSEALPGALKPAWTFDSGDKILNQTVIAGGIVFAAGEKKIFALEASSGKKLWEFKKEEAGSSVGSIKSSPVVKDGVLYAGDASGEVYALEAGSGKKLWAFKTESQIVTSPLIFGGNIIFGT